MAAASYYDAPAATQAQSHFQPPNTHVEAPGQPQNLGQEIPSEQRGYPQQGYNGQNSGGYGGQQQPMMGGPQTGQAPQQQQQMMNNGGGGQQQPAAADNRDTATKWLDKIEKKFGGKRFNDPANAEKNKALNANILKRLKQVGMMVMKKGPGMVMKAMR